MASNGLTYLVTGATGLIGRELIPRLLDRGGHVVVVVRAPTQQRRAELLGAWRTRADARDGRLSVVDGDVTVPGLGLEGLEPELRFDHVFHAAGYYDISASPEVLTAVNVDGTKHVLGWLREREFGGLLHHFSSIAVAGDYDGEFPEDEVELGQSHPNHYLSTKFEAERAVRASEGLRWRVYRPSAVVGHSRTGEMDRIDGPYYLFKPVLRARHALPGWFPIYGYIKEPLNMVPVDHVAQVIDYLAHKDGLDGRCFHVVDPDPPGFKHTWNLLAKASGAPEMKGVIEGRLLNMLPGAKSMVQQMGSTKFVRKQLMEANQIPYEVHAARNPNVTYATENLRQALEGSGIECPRQDEYITALFDYYVRHLDPDRNAEVRYDRTFAGKRILITGASSGVGAALAKACARHGAEVLVCARRADELEGVVSEIAAAGGRASYMTADLSDMEVCDAVCAWALEGGPVDILVNNAARSIRRSIADSLDRFHDYERVMRLNYFAPIRLTQGLLPSWRERQSGHLVNVLTAGAHMPSPRFGAYVSSKAALSAFTDTFAAEFLAENIFSTAVYLGWVNTPMMTATDKYKDKKSGVMTPEEAAHWVMDGIVDRKRHVKSATTTRRFIVNQLSPIFMTRTLNTLYQIYQDDPERYPEMALDRTLIRQFIKTDLF